MERMKLSFGDLYKVLRIAQEAATQFVDNPTYSKEFYKDSVEALRKNLLLDDDLEQQNKYAKMIREVFWEEGWTVFLDEAYKRKPWLKA
jgi:hypothetical protein